VFGFTLSAVLSVRCVSGSALLSELRLLSFSVLDFLLTDDADSTALLVSLDRFVGLWNTILPYDSEPSNKQHHNNEIEQHMTAAPKLHKEPYLGKLTFWHFLNVYYFSAFHISSSLTASFNLMQQINLAVHHFSTAHYTLAHHYHIIIPGSCWPSSAACCSASSAVRSPGLSTTTTGFSSSAQSCSVSSSSSSDKSADAGFCLWISADNAMNLHVYNYNSNNNYHSNHKTATWNLIHMVYVSVR